MSNHESTINIWIFTICIYFNRLSYINIINLIRDHSENITARGGFFLGAGEGGGRFCHSLEIFPIIQGGGGGPIFIKYN